MNRYIIAATAVSITTVAAIVSITRFFELSILFYVAILCLGTAASFILLRKINHIPVQWFWMVTFILHIAAIFGVALYEDDYFRFIWDGWHSLQGTPYGKPPSQFYGDPHIPGYLWPILDNVNNPKVPTIYGPTLQFIFAFTYFFAGTDPIGLRIIFAAINIILIAILTRRYPLYQVALYAWCPLVITELIIHIHPDAIMAAFIAGGLWLTGRHPILAGIFFGAAAASKIIALAVWPLLLRWPKRILIAAITTFLILYGYFAILGPSLGFDSTSTFANEWLFNPMGFTALAFLVPENIARLLAALIGIVLIMLIHARTQDKHHPPLAAIFGIILFFAPAVNSWYMIWILPFAISSRQIWPFVAASFIPLSYITGLTLDTETLREFEVHIAAWLIQIIAIMAALIYDFMRSKHVSAHVDTKITPIDSPSIAIIIPALNEAQSIETVVRSVQNNVQTNLKVPPIVIVADNGSNDGTSKIAQKAGARIICEKERGYGAACLAGIAALPDNINIILFIDADGSDVPTEAMGLLKPIIQGDADMVIGSRSLGKMEAGAMTPPQRFGNWLSTRLVKLIWQKNISDLGPFRAIRKDALQKLDMKDRDFGWTIEMQVKAIQHDMRVLERPADYRKRIGVSKISGTIRGVWGAGTKILYVIAREAFFR